MNEHSAERVAALRDAFAEAIEEMEDMLPYVPDYFREKWGYDESIAEARAALAQFDGSMLPPGSAGALDPTDPGGTSTDAEFDRECEEFGCHED